MGLIFKVIKLIHIAAIFLRIVFHSQIKGDLRIASIVKWDASTVNCSTVECDKI